MPIAFQQAGRIPAPGDNSAIAVCCLDAGTEVVMEGHSFTISHTVLEGHRFAICHIAPGEALLSWGLPFGVATRPIDAGEAVAHTEGGGTSRPNNLETPLRPLAGFMVNPNVGAVLAVDYGTETVTNALLRQFMVENDYPLADLPHRFWSLTANFKDN